MKKLLSVFLSVIMLLTIAFATGTTAFAKDSAQDLNHQQYNSQNCEFNYSNKTFVYSDTKNIYVSSSPNKKGKKLKIKNASHLAIKGKYIYYLQGDEYSSKVLKRCDKKGKHIKTIVKSKQAIRNFLIYGNKIIYTILEDSGEQVYHYAYSCSLNGKNKTQLFYYYGDSNLYVHSDIIYYCEDDSTSIKLLSYYDLKKKRIKSIKSLGKDVELIGIEKSKLILIKNTYNTKKYGFSFKYFTYNIKTKKFKTVQKGFVKDGLFYMENAVPYKKIFIAHSNEQGGFKYNIIKNGKIVYEKKLEQIKRKNNTNYYKCGNIGYYNNMLVILQNERNGEEGKLLNVRIKTYKP